jgi:hypothetical protein
MRTCGGIADHVKQSQFRPSNQTGQVPGRKGVMANRTYNGLRQNKANLRQMGPGRPSPRACPERRERAEGLDAATRAGNRAKQTQFARRGGTCGTGTVGQSCKTKPISPDEQPGGRPYKQSQFRAPAGTRGRLCQTNPNLGEPGYLGESAAGSLLCKTNPILAGQPGRGRVECAKQTQFATRFGRQPAGPWSISYYAPRSFGAYDRGGAAYGASRGPAPGKTRAWRGNQPEPIAGKEIAS